jgi:hypothetical protein
MLNPNGGMVDLKKPHLIKEKTETALIKRRDGMVKNGWVVIEDLFKKRFGEITFYCATLKYPTKEGHNGKNIWNHIRHQETK